MEENPFIPNEHTVVENHFQQNIENPFINNQNKNQKQRYRIIDLYWLINNKLFYQKKLEKNEVSLLCIGFNVDFQNLRFTFFSTDNNVFSNTHITINNAQRITVFSIYSEMAEQILFHLNQNKSIKLQNFERMIQQTNWTPNKSFITFTKAESSDMKVILQTTHNDNTYIYTFLDWQINTLKRACEFMINGQAWNLSMQRLINK